MEPSSFFSRYGDIAIFAAGVLMTVAGVLLVDAAATQVVLLLLGTGLMVMGALLPASPGRSASAPVPSR